TEGPPLRRLRSGAWEWGCRSADQSRRPRRALQNRTKVGQIAGARNRKRCRRTDHGRNQAPACLRERLPPRRLSKNQDGQRCRERRLELEPEARDQRYYHCDPEADRKGPRTDGKSRETERELSWACRLPAEETVLGADETARTQFRSTPGQQGGFFSATMVGLYSHFEGRVSLRISTQREFALTLMAWLKRMLRKLMSLARDAPRFHERIDFERR